MHVSVQVAGDESEIEAPQNEGIFHEEEECCEWSSLEGPESLKKSVVKRKNVLGTRRTRSSEEIHSDVMTKLQRKCADAFPVSTESGFLLLPDSVSTVDKTGLGDVHKAPLICLLDTF